MLDDIEFLKKMEWDKRQVYLYDSKEGFFKSNFINGVQEYCKRNEMFFINVTYDSVLKDLFRPTFKGYCFIYLDFDVLKREKALELFNNIYKRLEKGTLKNKMFITYSKEEEEKVYSEVTKLEKFKREVKVIESPRASVNYINKVIRFLTNSKSDLYDFSKLKNYEEFRRLMLKMIRKHNISLWETYHKLDFIAIDIKDDKVNLSSVRDFLKSEDEAEKLTEEYLGEFLIRKDRVSQARLMRQIVLSLNGKKNKNRYPKSRIIDFMFRAIRSFIRGNAVFDNSRRLRKDISNMSIQSLFTFNLLLAEYETKLMKQNFLCTLDVMLREFLAKRAYVYEK